MDLTSLAVVVVCLALGGILKGATGAGAPVLAVPALAMTFDVQFAVLVMLMPNLLSNIWQAWRFRHARLPGAFLWPFALAGAVGAAVGSVVLARVRPEALSLVVAVAVFAYIGFRLARPDWFVPFRTAVRLAVPAGLTAGLLQGASGVSAPASLTFLNAMGLQRQAFIATASVFFVAITAVQAATLALVGLVSAGGLLISLGAMLPIVAFMPVGAAVAKRFSKAVFDRAILVLLGALALKLTADAAAAL